MNLRIGRFSYSNLFPIFYMFDHACDCSGYEFVEGVPSELNRMLRDGEIDISPSSSIEYLKAPERYDYIEGHSISSNGPVGSILLFSRKPLDKLDGGTVMMTYQSDTSVAMLRIILSKFHGLSCRYRQTSDPTDSGLRSGDAYLLIGDDALAEAVKQTGMFIYDLGEIWTAQTGLPFVYALWLVRKDIRLSNPDAVNAFIIDLGRARKTAFTDLRKIAAHSPLITRLSEDDLIEYWQKMIDYDLTERHIRGLELFRDYSRELGLI